MKSLRETSRKWLAESFNRGAETLEEAAGSACRMASEMEQAGTLLEVAIKHRLRDVDQLTEAALLKYPLTIISLGSKRVPGVYSLGVFEIKEYLGALTIWVKGEYLGVVLDEYVRNLFFSLRAAAYFDRPDEEEKRQKLFAEAFKEVGLYDKNSR